MIRICVSILYTSDIFVIDQAAIPSMADCGNKLLKQETQTQYWAIMYKLGLHKCVGNFTVVCSTHVPSGSFGRDLRHCQDVITTT